MLRDNVLAIATDLGGAASHTAILTKSLEVPAVVGLRELSRLVKSGDTIIVNGNSGKVIVHPSPGTITLYEAKRAQYEAYLAELADIETLPPETLDGRRIRLNANIELAQEAKSAFRKGCDGIGLFRSEYLLLSQRRLPNEEEQFEDYRRVIELAAPRPVTIRTFDIGGDKMFPELPIPMESNPFMGWRAVRVGLDRPQLLKTQLRAILRAASFGKARVMFPLVIGLEEVVELKKIMNRAKRELKAEGVRFNANTPVGIMVELPSTALLADRLAREVDFFSIGTNDLTQFTLAVDRGNEMVASRYRPLHPAVLKLIAMTIEAGKRHGIEVALCGELAANPLASMLLVGMGLEDFSVSPVALLEIKKLVRSMEYSDAVAIAEHALQIDDANELVHYCAEEMKKRFANLPIWFSGDGYEHPLNPK
jgi:phosphotransferase system enzyme I (PtsI)